MKTIWIREFGANDNLEIRAVDDLPQPAADGVLVKVKAAALNRADLLQRRGFYPAPQGFSSNIPGLEFAGEIAAVGDDAREFKIGQRVFGITAGAAQAEFVSVPENGLVEIPANLDFVQAAAVPEAFITAHDAVFTQAELQAGETILIHAVGSGVGLAALQLAKAAGASVIGTSRTPDKFTRAAEFGLDAGIIADNQKIKTNSAYFAELINAQTGGNGVNVVLDLVGADYFAANIAALGKLGRLIFVGTTAGNRAEIDILKIMQKRLRLFGTVLRSRSATEKAAATAAFAAQVVPLLANGKVKPNVDRVFDFADFNAAYQYLESNQSFGKVVLKVQP